MVAFEPLSALAGFVSGCIVYKQCRCVVLHCGALRFVAIAFLSVVKQIPCDQGVLPKHGCLRGKNKYKLELLPFEKAWDKIQRDSADVYSSSSPFGQIPIC